MLIESLQEIPSSIIFAKYLYRPVSRSGGEVRSFLGLRYGNARDLVRMGLEIQDTATSLAIYDPGVKWSECMRISTRK